MAVRRGALLEMSFDLKPSAAGLAEVEAALLAQIAKATTPIDKLLGIIGIAAARRTYLLEAPDQPRHSATVEYDWKAFQMIRALPGGAKAVPIADRCSLARTDLILTDFHLDLPSLRGGYYRSTALLDDTSIDWSLEECVIVLHLLAENLGKQAEVLGDAGTPQTATALRIERMVNANDKTEPPAEHRYFLAVALARNAIASRLREDHDEAVKAIRASMREPDVMNDPGQTRLLKRLDATLRTLNVW